MEAEREGGAAAVDATAPPLTRRPLHTQTDGSEPNKLLVAELTVSRARVAAADAVGAAADGKPPPPPPTAAPQSDSAPGRSQQDSGAAVRAPRGGHQD